MLRLSDVRRIISALQEDGRMSLTELGARAGISHVAARKHLLKPLSEELVRVQALIGVDILRLRLALVLVEA